MARQLPSLIALRAFEAAARHLSFTDAANELSVTQGAISRHMKTLETQLRVALFRRLPRSLELTPEGASYYPALREALDLIEQATRRLFSNQQKQILTVSVLPTLAMTWFIPRLTAFNAQHPQIEIRMITSILPADFRTELDIAIRVGARRPASRGARIDLVMAHDWAGIAADVLMPDVLVPVCSPELVSQRRLTTPNDLKRVTLLHNATRPHAWADWLKAARVKGVPASVGPSFGHFFMAIQAAAEGQGVACVPSVLAENDFATGRLVAPFSDQAQSAGSYQLLYRQHERDIGKVAIFREWLLAETQHYRGATA